MGFSSLANMSRRINPCPNGRCRYSKRNGPVTGMVIHYNYGLDSYGEATNPGREVSANYWITNDGQILPNIDEQYRAQTSGAPGTNGKLADRHSITVEISNSPGFKTSSPMGAISPAAQKALEKLMADVFTRYKLGTPKRTKSATGVGVRFHNDFVDTSCPGPWITSKINQIMTNAAKIMGGGTPTQKEDGFLMALTDNEQKTLAARVQNIQDILTGFAPNKYVQKGYSLPLVVDLVRDALGVGVGRRARTIQDLITGGGPQGQAKSLLREILKNQETILARLDKLEGEN